MHRQVLHSQRLAQLFKNCSTELVRVGVLALPERVEPVLARVLVAQFEQSQFVAAQRYPELHAIHLHVRQERHYHFLCEAAEL